MPTYEVLIKAYSTVIVENAEDENEAINLAWENVDKGSMELDEAFVDYELTDKEDIELHKRHANQII